MALTEAHMLRPGQRFRTSGAVLVAETVCCHAVMARVVEGRHGLSRPGETAYIATGGPRNSLRVEILEAPRSEEGAS